MFEITRFRGASTITQQMVKNVFLSESRTIWRKAHEIILSQKVEKVLTKDRILETYLNCIEYGPGIYGIKKAALYYFKKVPSALTPREGAFLAMLLPSPKKYSVSFRKKRLSHFAQMRVKVILKKMRMGKAITREQYESEILQKFSWEN
jgi:monofunctional biosynthetic peptidoglycan transglycosylase